MEAGDLRLGAGAAIEGRCEYSHREANDSSSLQPPASSLLIVAGDLSGDLHCAMLVREIFQRHRDWKVHAVGGPHLRDSGAKILSDSSELSTIGFVPALQIVPRILRLRKRVLEFLDATPPDAVVLCDWGAFNGRLLPELQKRNIPVLYYFPPRSWARSGERGLAIATQVEKIATPFEWSANRLNHAGGDAEWVGHPILERIGPLPQNSPQRNAVRAEFGVQDSETLIAILAGSRALELKYIAPKIGAAIKLLRAQHPDWKFVAAVPPGREASTHKALENVQIAENRSAELLVACDAAIVKSGTSTLEAAVAGVPQVVVYDGPAAMRWQAKLMGVRGRVPFVAMPNILLQRKTVTELLGEDCTPQNIAREVERILTLDVSTRLQNDYTEVRRALGEELPQRATVRTAQMIDEMLEGCEAGQKRPALRRGEV
jgi:lipid-A-disaccharide synthase